MIELDYSKLQGKIKELYPTRASFADALGISPVSLSKKLNGKVQFTQKEIDKCCELLDIEKEFIPVYFFTKKVKEA